MYIHEILWMVVGIFVARGMILFLQTGQGQPGLPFFQLYRGIDIFFLLIACAIYFTCKEERSTKKY
jgi:hypothetical protein